MIQVFKPSLGEEELDALREIFKTGWIGLGPQTAAFESEFAAFCGASHAVGLNSATAALHLALKALGIGPGDEVLVPSLTFVSTVHAVEYVGAKPVFVDVDEDTLCLDPDAVPCTWGENVKAVIPVHYAGHPCAMDRLWKDAAVDGYAVIEDAAHACGSTYNGLPIGGDARSDAISWSFHAVKNLACGDGGMITTHRPELVEALHRLRWCGIDKSTWDRADGFKQYGWYYEVRELGYKCHMNDIAAAIGRVQLAKLPAMNARRREIAAFYTAALEELDWLRVPRIQFGTSSWHMYVIRTSHRDALNLYLKGKDIATGVHYYPIHLQPYYRSRGYVKLPVTERVWKTLLTLPMYPDLTDAEVEYVAETIRGFEPGRG